MNGKRETMETGIGGSGLVVSQPPATNPQPHLLFFISLFTFFVSPPLYAAFEDIGAGARGAGMGNAFSAIADDSQASYYNPAGLALVRRTEIASSYARLFMGLNDGSSLASGYLGFAQPLGRRGGGVGFSWSHFNLLGEYQENTFRISYGREIMKPTWRAGLTLKWLFLNVRQDQFTKTDPVFDFGKRNGRSGIGLDLGMLYQPLPTLRLAFTLQDVNQPNMGLGSSSPLPIGFKVGISYPSEKLNLAMDIFWRDHDIKWYSGVERWLFQRRFGIRGGFTVGNEEHRNLSFGLSYGESFFRIDYAFLFPLSGFPASGLGGISGTHRLALVVKLGSSSQIETASSNKRDISSKPEKAATQKPPESVEPPPPPSPPPPPPSPPTVKPPARPEKKIALPKPKGPAFHQVVEGDTLRSLAVQYYGDAERWRDIYRENREAVGPLGEILPGQRLMIPEENAK